MIIYRITNKVNGKLYIGQTIRSLKERWYGHCSPTSFSMPIHKAIIKYGRDNFCIEEIASYTNMEDLNNAEEYYIDFYNCLVPNGYNLKQGGGATGKAHPDTKKRLAAAQLGRKHSLATREKMSAWQIGKKVSDETRKKLSAAAKGKKRNLGKPLTEERKNNISLSLKGRKCTPEHIKAIAEGHRGLVPWNKGVPHTDATKTKLSIAMKGRKKSLETRRKMKLAWEIRKQNVKKTIL